MPADPVDFTAKAAVSLFELLQKSVNGISLSRAENKNWMLISHSVWSTIGERCVETLELCRE
jgi:hypothetical protein